MTHLTTYAVQGTQFTTTNSLRAFQKAKEKANGVPATVLKDGQPFCLVNKKGKIINL